MAFVTLKSCKTRALSRLVLLVHVYCQLCLWSLGQTSNDVIRNVNQL